MQEPKTVMTRCEFAQGGRGRRECGLRGRGMKWYFICKVSLSWRGGCHRVPLSFLSKTNHSFCTYNFPDFK